MTVRVLLVDDTTFMRRMLRDILAREGCEVSAEARNGREAVEVYRQLGPDLVIMDITMPEMDGVAAYARSPAPTRPPAS